MIRSALRSPDRTGDMAGYLAQGYDRLGGSQSCASRLNDKETADTAFEQLLTNRLKAFEKQRCFPSTVPESVLTFRPALKGNVVIFRTSVCRKRRRWGERHRANAGQPVAAYPFCTELSKFRSLTERIQVKRRKNYWAGHEACAVKSSDLD